MKILKRLKRYFSRKKGFTLIELLVVIAIIGILASIVIVSLNDARQGARDVKRVGDLNNLRTSLELYYSNNGAYPEAGTPGTCEDAQAASGVLATLAVATSDPISAQKYFYGSNTGGTDYVIGASLEDADASELSGGNDLDSTVLGCACDDSVAGGHTSGADPAHAYCISP